MVDYIIRESQNATSFESEYAEPCGWRSNFVRINLKAVAEGRITAEELADAFIASVVEVTEADLTAWRSEWAEIEHIVAELYPTLDGYKEDSDAISALLLEGKYVMHHSQQYNKHYAPHYRIVSRNEYNKLKHKLK